MKKLMKWAGFAVLGVVLLASAFLAYFVSSYPKKVAPSTEKVEITEARLARGKYLVEHISGCVDCHSARDMSRFAGPMVPGTEGQGGEVFDDKLMPGFPGAIYAKNITPAGIGSWSDGELINAITLGLSKDGTPLFPLMPYMGYNKYTKEDLYSVVAYIRSLKPIEKSVPARSLSFPLNIIVRSMPLTEYTPTELSATADAVTKGKYLVTIAGCMDCHTPQEKGKFIEGKEFAGGMKFSLPGGMLNSANITPDKETGIGSWDKARFVQRFKAFEPDSMKNIKVASEDFTTVMPWFLYAGMTEEDLGNIYEYLHSVKAVNNKVTHFEPHNAAYTGRRN